jgi:hypothetical protein
MTQPAFPTCADNGHSTNQDGMTLRDYFAAKAMQGFCATLTGASNSATPKWSVLASDAYTMADAMLKAREA